MNNPAQKIRFKKDSREFHQEIIKKVAAHFKANGNNDKANGFMIFKSLFYLGTLFASYFALIFGGFDLWVNNILWVIFGLASVFVAVNIGHDAIHGAYSKKGSINRFMSLSFNLVGANAYMWEITHNIVHHTYTNIAGHDEDIEAVPFARLAPDQDWKPFMKYQHIWLFFLYPLATLSWVFKKDYVKMFQKQIGGYDNSKHKTKDIISLFFFKFLYYFLFIVIPIIMIDFPWYYTFGGFILGHLFEGFAITLIFMLAHVVEDAHFPIPDEFGNMEHNWAVHQMYTTVNFGRQSWLTGFITGGLNFQVEHHLFPKVCHVHYPAISKIIQETAEKYNIPYNDYPSFGSALASHVRFLKNLGAGKQLNQTDQLKYQKAA